MFILRLEQPALHLAGVPRCNRRNLRGCRKQEERGCVFEGVCYVCTQNQNPQRNCEHGVATIRLECLRNRMRLIPQASTLVMPSIVKGLPSPAAGAISPRRILARLAGLTKPLETIFELTCQQRESSRHDRAIQEAKEDSFGSRRNQIRSFGKARLSDWISQAKASKGQTCKR